MSRRLEQLVPEPTSLLRRQADLRAAVGDEHRVLAIHVPVLVQDGVEEQHALDV
jgi:hypothetical protein